MGEQPANGKQSCAGQLCQLLAGEIEQLVLMQIQEHGRRAEGASFAAAWEKLSSAEQTEVVARWVERIDYDGTSGTMAITFHADCGRPGGEDRAEAAKEINS